MTTRLPAELTALEDDFSDVRADRHVELLYDDGRWLEGPAYSAQTRTLVFSDIPNDRTLRLDEITGGVTTMAMPSRFANGRTVDPAGRFVTCSHGDRAVVRQEHDGSVRTIASRANGARLNSPNDVVVDAVGGIWFTDPTYGIRDDYEGHRATPEQPVSGVYRWDPATDRVDLVGDEFAQPNGLAFSPDERTLYVTDSERNRLLACDVAGPRMSSPRTIATRSAGLDGIRTDSSGRIWAATGDGVSCFAPTGREIGRLVLPEHASNVCFGGPQRNILYITATTSLYAIRLSVQGSAVTRLP